jgi:hypothetical protein
MPENVTNEEITICMREKLLALYQRGCHYWEPTHPGRGLPRSFAIMCLRESKLRTMEKASVDIHTERFCP